MHYSYHNRLKQLLRTEQYIVEQGKPPFAYRFLFPAINKSMPIRPHRVAEYQKYLGGSNVMKIEKAIEILRNKPGVIFESKRHNHKVTIEIKNEYLIFKRYKPDGDLIEESKQGGAFNYNCHIDLEWEEVKEPADFMTAVKAYADYKKIKCILGSKESVYRCGSIASTMWDLATEASGISAAEILHGKWYIED